jgi:hypothetical protein
VVALAWYEDRVEGAAWLGGAEIMGEDEAGEFGVDGRSEAIGEGEFGAVSSARTNAGSGYPQMTRVWVGGSAVPNRALCLGLGSWHRQFRAKRRWCSVRGVVVGPGELVRLPT